MDAEIQERKMHLFLRSQAIFTPSDLSIMWTATKRGRPSLFQWTKKQYEENGQFDEWLKSVKTCRTRTKCCEAQKYGNIISRDFPTSTFASNVVMRNYKSASSATGSEGSCERAEVAAEERRKAEEERRRAEAAAKAERERKAREEAARQERTNFKVHERKNVL